MPRPPSGRGRVRPPLLTVRHDYDIRREAHWSNAIDYSRLLVKLSRATKVRPAVPFQGFVFQAGMIAKGRSARRPRTPQLALHGASVL